MRQFRILISGLGSVGRRHAQNLKTLGYDQITVFDPNAAALEFAAHQLGIKSIFSSYSEALHENPDIVFIASPTFLHAEQALAAAQKDTHLFIEKPLSHSLEKLDLIQGLIEKKNLITMTACNMRFHPGIVKLKELIQKGKLGKVYAARALFGYYLPFWRNTDYKTNYAVKESTGGGIILDAIHEIDSLYYFFGKAKSLAACSQKMSNLEIETEDMAQILITFENGVQAQIHLDYLNRRYSRRVEVIGQKGSAVWDWNGMCSKVELFEGGETPPVSFTCEEKSLTNQMYLDEIEYFLSCVEKKQKTFAPFSAGREVLEIAMAIKESSKNQKFYSFAQKELMTK